MEDDLDAVVMAVEELAPPKSVHDRISVVLYNVMSGNRWQTGCSLGKYAPLETYHIVLR